MANLKMIPVVWVVFYFGKRINLKIILTDAILMMSQEKNWLKTEANVLQKLKPMR